MSTIKADLEERLIGFAAMVLKVAEQLPNELKATFLGSQLLHSATAPAMSYAVSADTPKDFLNKLKQCLKDLRDTHILLRIAKRIPSLDAVYIDPALEEGNHLIAIFAKSVKTKKNNMANGTKAKTGATI